MDSRAGIMEQLETELSQSIEDAQIKLENSKSENVVLLGNTGVGKSTVYCGLRGDNLVATRNKRLKMIISNKNERDTTIGQGLESQTKRISCFYSTIRKQNQYVQICDTPGFSDTGSKKENAFDKDSGYRNIIQSALIKFTLKQSQKSTILIVLDFSSYQAEREMGTDPLTILIQMIPNLDQMYSSIGILINKVDEGFETQEVLGIISNFYYEKKQMKISQMISKFAKDEKIGILYRPSLSKKDQTLTSSYFDNVSQLIKKLEGRQFSNLKSVLQNSDSRLFAFSLIEQQKSEFQSYFQRQKPNYFYIPDLKKKTLEEKQQIKNQIEYIQLKITQQFNKLISNDNCENQAENTLLRSKNILNILSHHLIDSHLITQPLQRISNMLSICEIHEKQFIELELSLYIYLDYLIKLYFNISTQAIQQDNHLKYPLPEETPKFRKLICRKPQQNKGILEKGFDFLLTLGNACFEEHYLVLIQRSNGEFFVEKRIYQNEYNLSDFRGKTEFDHTDYYEKKLKLIESISQLNQVQRNDLLKDYYSNKIARIYKSDEVSESKLANVAGQIAKNVVGTAIVGNVAFITVKETFKVVNNALVKEGIKGFMSIGGKKMMVEGAKVIVTQAGKQITEGIVVQAAKETVVIGTKTAIGTAASLGLNLLVSATIGAVKSAINTKWRDETEYICNIFYTGFDLDMLDDENISETSQEVQVQKTSQKTKH